ncbi:MAG: hypothetical protein FWC34_04445 [Bacteroidetes bacterium]|nr:hypothetical protein [Bacteroidota bacterium]MCL2303252.1 hypothetical protein [Lentimicrobiaceae bacterium]
MASLATFLPFVIGVTIVVVVTIVTLQRARYRRIIKKKNEGLIRHILEENQLQEKMKTMEVEKKVIEKMLFENYELRVTNFEIKPKNANN